MRGWLAVALGLAVGCGQASTDSSPPHRFDEDPPREPPESPHFARPAEVARGMHVRFDELRTIERLLVAGDLNAAKGHATAIAGAPVDPGMHRWAAEVADVQAAARAVAGASTVADALQGETRLAARCATCHVATGSSPTFRTFPPRPPETAVMSRHQWAVDRLWEGMIGATDEPWAAGLDELARAQPPPTKRDQQALAERLQRLAIQTRATLLTDELSDRVAKYGELLATCAGCHDQR